MGFDQNDDDDRQDDQSDYQSGSFRIQKPYSIDRYFGKLDGTIKFLQLTYKLKIGNRNDTTLELKTQKSQKNSSMLPNLKLNFKVKDKKDKLSVSFKPYCMIPKSHGGLYTMLYPFEGGYADLDLSYTTLLFPNSHQIKMVSKIKDKGELNLKLSRSFNIVENCLKIYLESFTQFTKHKQYKFKNSADITYKTLGRRFQINKDYYTKMEEKVACKISNQLKTDFKIENSLQILSEQLKSKEQKNVTPDDQNIEGSQEEQKDYKRKKQKPLYQIKLYSCNKFTGRQKVNKLGDYFSNLTVKSSVALSENIYNTNYKLDFQTSNRQLLSWDAKAFIQKNKLKFGGLLAKKYSSRIGESTNNGEKQEGAEVQIQLGNKSNGYKWELFVQRESLFNRSYLNLGLSYGSSLWGLRAWGKINKRHKYEFLLRQKVNNYSQGKKSNLNYGVKYTYNS